MASSAALVCLASNPAAHLPKSACSHLKYHQFSWVTWNRCDGAGNGYCAFARRRSKSGVVNCIIGKTVQHAQSLLSHTTNCDRTRRRRSGFVDAVTPRSYRSRPRCASQKRSVIDTRAVADQQVYNSVQLPVGILMATFKHLMEYFG